MPRAREISRIRAKAYRLAKAKVAEEEEDVRRKQLSRVLRTARDIVAAADFAEVAKHQGAAFAPRRLLTRSAEADDEGQEVLDFIVVWKFFFPTFRVEAVRQYLERDWPGFIDEMKDAFIALVMRGPFDGERRPSMTGNSLSKDLLT